jgi:hypothetical protein
MAITEKPEAIMMNIPAAFFQDKKIDAEDFIQHYKLNTEADPFWSFHHFISSVPVHEVMFCYLVFFGLVQMKVRIVEFHRMQRKVFVNANGSLDSYGPRNWMIGTGPVVIAPAEIKQKGFRGFRYSKHLF